MITKAVRVFYNSIRFLGFPCYRNLLAVETSVRIEKAKNAKLTVGKKFRARRNVELNIRDEAQLIIGDEVFLNSGCILTARGKITIGDKTIIGPNVIVYDHDHQIVDGQILDHTFVTEAVHIGKSVWIGAGAIILKGTVIGDNCIIAAGSVVKGIVPNGSILVQKRESTFLQR